MGKYDFLETLNKEQLLGLQNACEDENLLKYVANILASSNLPSYESTRTVYINDTDTSKYESIASSLDLKDLKFFKELVFDGKGNNIGMASALRKVDKAILIYSNKDVQNIAKMYGIPTLGRFWHIYNHGVYYQDEWKKCTALRENERIKKVADEANYFRYLDEFFKDEQNVIDCEGTYNSYMYIKEYIYHLISLNKDANIDDLFKENADKKKIIRESFKDICEYLYNLRESVPNSRLSAFNNKISYAGKNDRDAFTEQQLLFMDMLAFGTTLEQLEKRDYKDYGRLVYVPKKYYNN